MDKASSQFLDTMVMDKLLGEKLEKVQHLPEHFPQDLQEPFCSAFSSISSIGEIKETADGLLLQSPVETMYKENSSMEIKVHIPENPKGAIVLLHGLFEDNRDIYSFLIKGLLQQGFVIYHATLPYHFERTPEKSLFSGEFFWSAHIKRTRNAFEQAVYELYQLVHFAKSEWGHAYITGFSMGATVSMMLGALYDEIDGICAINPSGGLCDIVWDSPLCKTIKQDFLSGGYTQQDMQKVFSLFEPLGSGPKISIDNILMISALYDKVTEQYQYENMKNKWKLIHTVKYNAGHLNTLRVPRLATDISTFFQRKQNDTKQ